MDQKFIDIDLGMGGSILRCRFHYQSISVFLDPGVILRLSSTGSVNLKLKEVGGEPAAREQLVNGHSCKRRLCMKGIRIVMSS